MAREGQGNRGNFFYLVKVEIFPSDHIDLKFADKLRLMRECRALILS